MSERKPHQTHVFVEPVEVSIKPDGVGIVVETTIFATDEETGQEAIEVTAGILGMERVPENSPSQSFFAFSSNRWNSPWQPKGPKPNWSPGSQDPSKN